MSSAAATSTPAKAATASAPAAAASCPSPNVSPVSGLKICCACPETRAPRDECVVRFGEERCAEYIEAHKVCLRGQGFKV